MNIGKLDRKIYIQSATLTTSDAGDAVRTWTTRNMLYAYRIMTGGSEQYVSQKLTISTFYDYYTRYADGITANMRLYDCQEKKYYDIIGVEIVQRRAFMKLRVKLFE